MEMTPNPQGPPQAPQPNLPALFAAVMFGARHQTYAPVPDNPGTSRLVDRINIVPNLDEGSVTVLMDPGLYAYFATTPFLLLPGHGVVEGLPPPHNLRVVLAARIQGRPSGLLLANGQVPVVPPGPDDIAKLKAVLG